MPKARQLQCRPRLLLECQLAGENYLIQGMAISCWQLQDHYPAEASRRPLYAAEPEIPVRIKECKMWPAFRKTMHQFSPASSSPQRFTLGKHEMLCNTISCRTSNVLLRFLV